MRDSKNMVLTRGYSESSNVRFVTQLCFSRTRLTCSSSSIGAAALKRTVHPAHVRLALLAVDLLSWAATMVFVGVGWLLFFYPIEKAVTMALALFVE